MHFSTRQKNYTDSQARVKTEPGITGPGFVSNPARESPSNNSNKGVDKKQATDAKRPSILEGTKNDQLFESFPQLNIHRVDSAEHREKLKLNYPVGGSYQTMTNSLISKPYTRGDSKLTSTSAEKSSSSYYLNTRQNVTANQSDIHRASYKLNYATYKKDGNSLLPNYTYGGVNSQDGSDNQVPSYKRIGNVMTMERMDMEISPKMVSSVISRESSGKDANQEKGQRVYLSTSSKNRDENKEDEQAYELFASRHPNESIRKSTIEISKAISSNAITQLQRQNENQEKKIKKLEKQLDEFKNSLKKWDEIKHRYQMDLESKSRQIFDLERANKRLSEQVQGIRAYRTMDSVEQVIIVRLKQQIMQLNKKIIEMQAEHYKNQKSFLEKQSKKDGSKGQIQSNQKQTIKKLEQSAFTNKKQSELLGIELQKEKEKCWNLQRQREEYLAQKSVTKENYEREAQNNRKQILSLRQEVQKFTDTIRAKDAKIEQIKLQSENEGKKINQKLLRQKQQEKKGIEARQKLNAQLLEKDRVLEGKLLEQKQAMERQFNEKLAQKEKQYQNNLNNEMRLYQAKIIEQGKNLKLKQSEEASQGYLNEISQLRRTLEDSQNYIRELQGQGENMRMALRERDIEIEHLKIDNLKIIDDINKEINQKARWKQEEAFIIQNQMKLRFQQQFKQKEKELQTRAASINNLEQSVKQMKLKLEQQGQQQAAKIEAEVKEKEQKVQSELRAKQQQSIKDLQASKLKLTDEVKKAQATLSAANKEVSAISSKKTQVESELSLKQKELKQIQVTITDIKTQLQSKLTELAQADSQKKSLIAETQRLREAEEQAKTSNKNLEDKCKQLETKYNAVVSQLSNSRSENFNIEQKFKQAQIELGRFTDSVNAWKTKSQNLESTTNKLKTDLASLQKEREELRVKAKEAEIAKKYHELLPQYELLQQKLRIKEQEVASREAAFLKIRHNTEAGDSKASVLSKEIRTLSNKLEETESKLKAILSKLQIEEFKYKQLYQKLVSDTQVYMGFIKKLQEDNELIAQKYWKIRKLVKKEKINDENDLLEKHDYATYRQFLEQHIITHFKKIIMPAFEAKILKKISSYETSLSHKVKRLVAVKTLVEHAKRKRAEKAKLTN